MLGGVCKWDLSGRRSRRDLAPTSWMLTEDKLCARVLLANTPPGYGRGLGATTLLILAALTKCLLNTIRQKS